MGYFTFKKKIKIKIIIGKILFIFELNSKLL